MSSKDSEGKRKRIDHIISSQLAGRARSERKSDRPTNKQRGLLRVAIWNGPLSKSQGIKCKMIVIIYRRRKEFQSGHLNCRLGCTGGSIDRKLTQASKRYNSEGPR